MTTENAAGEPSADATRTAAGGPDGQEFVELARLRAALEEMALPPATLRADAARNRERVLAAAERLFATRDARHITMEDIARAAGVGRATLYRRFPTPAAVALALLDEHERRVQEDILRGEPPLGPGAPPAERLAAFYTAMVELLEGHLHLALGAETGSTRFRTGAYRFWRLHVRLLLADARDDEVDATVDQLLAPLAPELYHFQRHELGLSQEQITMSLTSLARKILSESPG